MPNPFASFITGRAPAASKVLTLEEELERIREAQAARTAPVPGVPAPTPMQKVGTEADEAARIVKSLPKGVEGSITYTAKSAPSAGSNRMLGAEELNAIMEAAEGTSFIENQKKGAQDFKELLATNLALTPPQIDLLPLAALSDEFFGGNLSKTLPRSESSAEYRNRALGTLSAGRKADLQVADSVMDVAGLAKIGALDRRDTEGYKVTVKPPTGKTAGEKINDEFKALAKEFFEQDKYRKMSTRIDFAKQSKDLLAQGSGPADQIFKTALTRASGDSRPSNFDIQRIAGDPRIAKRIREWWDKYFATGTMSPENREIMEKIVETARVAAVRDLWKLADGKAKVFAERHPGQSRAQIRRQLMETSGFPDELPEIPEGDPDEQSIQEKQIMDRIEKNNKLAEDIEKRMRALEGGK